MVFSTIIGILLAIMALGVGIAHGGGDLIAYMDIAGALIVFGGSFAMAYMSYNGKDVNAAMKTIATLAAKPQVNKESIARDILTLIKWGYLVQGKGLVALENEVKGAKGDLLLWGGQLVATGYTPEHIRHMMHNAAEAQMDRQLKPAVVLKAMASAGPAFGMVGTLTGLVIMLQAMGDDMAKLGQAMALAMLATLYGVIGARLIFMPAANKQEERAEAMYLRNRLIGEGLALLAEKQSPRQMQDHLNSFLDVAQHFDIDRQFKG